MKCVIYIGILVSWLQKIPRRPMTTMPNSKSNPILIRKIKLIHTHMFLKFTITTCQCHIAMSVTKSLRHSIHRFQKQQSVKRVVRHTTSSCSQNLCRCTKQSLDRCRTWQSGIALWEKTKYLADKQ